MLRQEPRDFAKGIHCIVSSAVFGITLRLDDLPIVRLIHSFLSCGKLRMRNRTHKTMKEAKPAAEFLVSNVTELATCIIPHFDKYPLLAKKRRDFAIWREGVLLCNQVKSRKRIFRSDGTIGTIRKWTDDEVQRFYDLSETLKQQRRFQSPDLPLPPPLVIGDNEPLFDSL